MSSREKFEAWAERENLSLAYGDCGYVYSSTEAAWNAWQASSAAVDAQVVDLAVQLANAESRTAAVVAENAGLKDGYRYRVRSLDGDDLHATKETYDEAKAAGWHAHDKGHYYDCPVKTPATDAFLADVRAQGVEELADYWDGMCNHKDTFVGSRARRFAASLRSVVTVEGGNAQAGRINE